MEFAVEYGTLLVEGSSQLAHNSYSNFGARELT